MDHPTLIKLATDIVSAHVSRNEVVPAELPELIHSIYRALAQTESIAFEVPVQRPPAVPIHASVAPHEVACLECGRRMKLLKQHLRSEHGLSPDEYRGRWGLNANIPLVAPLYAERRREIAHASGLGRRRAA